jgi:hypothetical protein
VRDGLHLSASFGARRGVKGEPIYTFVTVRDASRLEGVAVVRQPKLNGDPRLRGVRVATISDIVYPLKRRDVGLALLGAVEGAAKAANSDAILCSTSHHDLAGLLRRQAYFRVAGNLHFLLRDTNQTTRWPKDLASWWLARGDANADEVF